MKWLDMRKAPPARVGGGILNRFSRVGPSIGDRTIAAAMNADEVGDREALRRKLVKYGKWHNPRRRTEPPSNMNEGWLVAENPPPRLYEEPRPDGPPDQPDEPPDQGGDQDPQKPR